MNSEQHKRILFTTLKKWFPAEEDSFLDRVAQAQITRFEVAMELWMEEREQGIKEPEEPAPVARQRPQPMEETLPPPPKGGSLIIDPASEKGKETLDKPDRYKARVPLRLPTQPKNLKVSGEPRKYWSQNDLRDYIDANTPEAISVMVEGRDKPVALARNIEVQLGPETVKLIYGVDGTLSPTNSSPNSPQIGEILSPISIDVPVCKTFDCYTQYPDLDAAMSQIHELAKIQLRPRPESIASSTPRQTGPLSFRMPDPRKPNDPQANPHDEVGETRNPFNGKVW